MQRIAVVGNAGSGKSTLARRLADGLGLRHVELDAIFHQPGWQPLPEATFRARVEDAVRADRWVVCGNYGAVRDLVWPRADTIVWLDLPRRVVTPRIVRRSVVRAITRRELWNGNREEWRNLLSADPERSIVLWSITQHATNRAGYRRRLLDDPPQDVEVVHLRSPGAVRRWLRATLSAARPAG
ncbi:adenylate kinase [Egicoccus sp. AB-alg2]|uniref:adenylate kinase n=1 Tax=Egicoccus sp. AB-alg2 TaxID=3242693 RepID=UPI00359E883C